MGLKLLAREMSSNGHSFIYMRQNPLIWQKPNVGQWLWLPCVSQKVVQNLMVGIVSRQTGAFSLPVFGRKPLVGQKNSQWAKDLNFLNECLSCIYFSELLQ